MGVVEVEALVVLGDDDGVLPVGGEVEVVGVGDRDPLADGAGLRVDRGQPVARGLVGDDVERLQVVGRHDVLRFVPDRIGPDRRPSSPGR